MIAILAVLAITILVLIDWTLQLILAWRARRAATRLSSQAAGSYIQEPFDPPQGLFYHKGHSWAFLEPNGCLRVGLDGLVSFLLGRFESVRLPEPGQQVREGEPLARFVREGREMELASPVSGTIVEVNRELAPDGLFVSSDPYGAGWICEIRPESLSGSLSVLVVAERATEWHMSECKRATEFFKSKGRGDIGLDGIGPKASASGGVLVDVNDATWREFQSKFIDSKRRKEG